MADFVDEFHFLPHHSLLLRYDFIAFRCRKIALGYDFRIGRLYDAYLCIYKTGNKNVSDLLTIKL